MNRKGERGDKRKPVRNWCSNPRHNPEEESKKPRRKKAQNKSKKDQNKLKEKDLFD